MATIKMPELSLPCDRIAAYTAVFNHLVAKTKQGMTYEEMRTIMQKDDYTVLLW